MPFLQSTSNADLRCKGKPNVSGRSTVIRKLLFGVMSPFIGVALLLGVLYVGVTLLVSGHATIGWSIILGLVAWVAYGFMQGSKQLDDLIHNINRNHGTHFARTNGFGTRPCIYFDDQKKKLLIVDGKQHRVENFSFVRSWALNWIERGNLRTGALRYSDVHIELQTTDYQTPLIRIPCLGKSQGDLWNARMELLFR